MRCACGNRSRGWSCEASDPKRPALAGLKHDQAGPIGLTDQIADGRRSLPSRLRNSGPRIPSTSSSATTAIAMNVTAPLTEFPPDFGGCTFDTGSAATIFFSVVVVVLLVDVGTGLRAAFTVVVVGAGAVVGGVVGVVCVGYVRGVVTGVVAGGVVGGATVGGVVGWVAGGWVVGGNVGGGSVLGGVVDGVVGQVTGVPLPSKQPSALAEPRAPGTRPGTTRKKSAPPRNIADARRTDRVTNRCVHAFPVLDERRRKDDFMPTPISATLVHSVVRFPDGRPRAQ